MKKYKYFSVVELTRPANLNRVVLGDPDQPLKWRIYSTTISLTPGNREWYSPTGRDIGIGDREDLKIVVPALEVVFEKSTLKETASTTPPAVGEALLLLFCAKKRCEAVLGDLAEAFAEEVASKGERHAKVLFWARVIRSIGPLLWMTIRRAGILAALFEIGRRSW
jgi:hypothetical protein